MNNKILKTHLERREERVSEAVNTAAGRVIP